MILAGQAIQNPGKSFAIAMGICCGVFTLLLVALMHEIGMSPAPVLLAVASAALLVLAFRHPLACTGGFLAFMPFFPVTFLIAEFFGPPFLGKLEGVDRAVLLLLVCFLWHRNGIKLARPDWFLLFAFGLAVLRIPLDGSPLQVASDFGFVIAYVAGRVAGLTVEQETRWAKRAIWIVAIVSVLGLAEVLLIGPGPRTLLYLKTAEAATDNGLALNASFRAVGFDGLRLSGTMFGPLQFGPLCMVALIIWWVYSRKPLVGGLIALGMLGTLTRSAWVGTAVAIPVVAIGLGQAKRFVVYGILGLALLATAAPLLGFGDYFSSVKAGEDPSAGQHQDSLLEGLTFVASHPIGSGSANVGRQALKSNPDAVTFENEYIDLAGEYGIPVVFCMFGFLLTAIQVSWRQHTLLGFLASGIIIGFSTVLMFAGLNDVFTLACWIWFPVGLAVAHSAKSGPSKGPFYRGASLGENALNGVDDAPTRQQADEYHTFGLVDAESGV